MHRAETGESGKGKGFVASAEPFHEQDVKDMVVSARKINEPQESQQGGKKTFLQSFSCKSVFRDNEVVDCVVLKEMSLTAQKKLSHGALDSKRMRYVDVSRMLVEGFRTNQREWTKTM